METATITCNCEACNGLSAKVALPTNRDLNSATVVHNTVRIAHGPLARTASVREFGPWKA